MNVFCINLILKDALKITLRERAWVDSYTGIGPMYS